MKVVVFNDSKQFRQSLTRLLRSVKGIAIVGYAQHVETARIVTEATNPEIVVLDERLLAGSRL
jgi:chemotaxis response regulator CheB